MATTTVFPTSSILLREKQRLLSQSAASQSSIIELCHSPCTYVYSRLTLYYASLIDLRWYRSIHSCETCNGHSNTNNVNREHKVSQSSHKSIQCNAVHYGQCTVFKNVSAGHKNGPKRAARVVSRQQVQVRG